MSQSYRRPRYAALEWAATRPYDKILTKLNHYPTLVVVQFERCLRSGIRRLATMPVPAP